MTKFSLRHPFYTQTQEPTNVCRTHVLDPITSIPKLFGYFIRLHFDRKQMSRFALIGILNTGIDILAFWLLMLIWPVYHDGLQAAFESLLAWTLASVFGFVMHSRFSFRKKLPLVGFYFITGLGVSVQMFLSGYATHAWGSSGAMLGKFMGICLASSFTYIGYNWLTTNSNKKGNDLNCMIFNTSSGAPSKDNFRR